MTTEETAQETSEENVQETTEETPQLTTEEIIQKMIDKFHRKMAKDEKARAEVEPIDKTMNLDLGDVFRHHLARGSDVTVVCTNRHSGDSSHCQFLRLDGGG